MPSTTRIKRRSRRDPRTPPSGGTHRFRPAVTEATGFYHGSGFIDDARAFLSIPARHDMSRRLDAAHLAPLVAEGRLDLATAQRMAVDLADAIPRTAFKL